MTKTSPRIFSLIIRFIIGLFGIIMWTLVFFLAKDLIKEFSESLFIGLLTFFSLGLLFIGTGFLSIKTYSINNKQLVEHTFGGLVKIKIELNEIEKMKIGQALIGFGKTVEQIILNLKNGTSIIISDFDQRNYNGLKAEIEKNIEYDDKIKPNYFTKFWRIIIIVFSTWIVLMSLILIF